MDGVGSLQSYAVMRTLVIVEVYEALYLLQSFLVCLETLVLAIWTFTLDNAVHTLCNGIVSGFVVLRHGYLYAVFLQFLHIEIAAVLYASV